MRQTTELGLLIKRRCKELKIRQSDLALACGLNISTISRYTRGIDYPSKETALKIDEVLKLSPGTLEGFIVRKEPERNVYYHSAEELKVLGAWKRGERTVEEVQRITGLPLKKIGKYLPLNEGMN